MKRLAVVLIIALALASCATQQLPDNATFKEKSAAVCSDLQAAVLLAQWGLTVMQRDNWAYDYGKAQQTLVEANTLITTTCAAAQTEGDLLAVRNAVLAALAKAAQEQGQVGTWQ